MPVNTNALPPVPDALQQSPSPPKPVLIFTETSDGLHAHFRNSDHQAWVCEILGCPERKDWKIFNLVLQFGNATLHHEFGCTSEQMSRGSLRDQISNCINGAAAQELRGIDNPTLKHYAMLILIQGWFPNDWGNYLTHRVKVTGDSLELIGSHIVYESACPSYEDVKSHFSLADCKKICPKFPETASWPSPTKDQQNTKEWMQGEFLVRIGESSTLFEAVRANPARDPFQADLSCPENLTGFIHPRLNLSTPENKFVWWKACYASAVKESNQITSENSRRLQEVKIEVEKAIKGIDRSSSLGMVPIGKVIRVLEEDTTKIEDIAKEIGISLRLLPINGGYFAPPTDKPRHCSRLPYLDPRGGKDTKQLSVLNIQIMIQRWFEAFPIVLLFMKPGAAVPATLADITVDLDDWQPRVDYITDSAINLVERKDFVSSMTGTLELARKLVDCKVGTAADEPVSGAKSEEKSLELTPVENPHPALNPVDDVNNARTEIKAADGDSSDEHKTDSASKRVGGMSRVTPETQTNETGGDDRDSLFSDFDTELESTTEQWCKVEAKSQEN